MTARDDAPRSALLLAWCVHAFTASGAVLAVATLHELARGGYAAAAIYALLALSIDSVDGALARRARVAERVPGIDGRRLDDIVDFLNFAVVPVVWLLALDALLHPALAALPVLASAYGFAQRNAKTPDDFFLGWPSYWNVLALYVWLLGTSPAVCTALVLLFSAGVFVPLKYLYPSRQPRWRALSVGGGFVWVWLVALAVWFPELAERTHLVEVSLLYPAYYLLASAWLGDWLGLARSPSP